MSTLLSAALVILTPYVGISESKLDWNIASSFGETTPNVLSELTYDNIETIDYGVKLAFIQPLSDVVSLKLEGDISVGMINGGKGQDSDYLGDDRTNEFIRSYASIKGDQLTQYKLGAGISLPGIKNGYYFSVLAGITKSEQSLEVHHGKQAIYKGLSPDEFDSLSEYLYDNLDSSYDAEWDGYYIAVEGGVDTHYGRFTFRYDRIDFDYEAVADWNLRGDFDHPKSFSHHADGKGDRYELGYLYEVNPNLGIGITLKHETYKTEPGFDKVFFSDGSVQATQLNEVSWESTQAVINVSYGF